MSWLLTWPAAGYYAILIVNGMCFATRANFYPIFLEEQLKVTDEWWGYLVTIGAIASIILQLIAGILHGYIGIGSMNLIILCSVISALKSIIVAFFEPVTPDSTPWGLIIIQWMDLQVAQYVGVIGYASKIAPSHLRAAALGISTSCLFVIGSGFGSLIGGFLNDQLDSIRMTYKITGFFCLCFYILYFILYHWIIKFKEHPPEGVDCRKNSDNSKNDIYMVEVNAEKVP